MKRIHFDSRGRARHHYFFWQPWGCLGCLGRVLLFFVLFFFFLLLLSQFRSCRPDDSPHYPLPYDYDEPAVVEEVLPPIDDSTIIDDGARRIVSNRLNVLFKAEVGRQGIEQWTAHFDSLYPDTAQYKVLFCDMNTKLMSLQVPAERRRALITELPQQIPSIPFLVFEEEVMEMPAPQVAPDTSVAAAQEEAEGMWYLDFLHAAPAWESTHGEEDIIVAVVDSYFDISDPVFENTIVLPYNVNTGSADVSLPASYDARRPDPVMCHGTMVAALALGGDIRDNKCGIAPGCSFMPISLSDRIGSLSLLQGILYAINHGAQVINVSAGLQVPEQVRSWPIEDQIQAARRELLEQEDVWKYVFDMCGQYYVTLVWAAGNEDVFTALDASKRGDSTIKVSAVDKDNKKASFSNFGNFASRGIFESTVSAPGVDVYGYVPAGDDATVNGTSFAAPLVAGTAGLMKSLDPTLSTRRIADILKATGRPADVATIGPAINTGAAVDSVWNTFMDYNDVKNIFMSSTPVDIVIDSTFLMRFSTDEQSDQSLAPLMTMSIHLHPAGRREFVFTDNTIPARQWRVPLDIAYDGSTLRIKHDASQTIEGYALRECEYTIKADTDGVAYVDIRRENEADDIITRYLFFKRAV